MRTNFIKDFINEITSDNLHRNARTAFDSLSYSPITQEKICELKEQLDKKIDSQNFYSIDNEISNWDSHGDRIVQWEENNEIHSVVISHEQFFSDYYQSEVQKCIKKLNADFIKFINDLNLSGLKNTDKSESLLSILSSVDAAAFRCLDNFFRFREINLSILAAVSIISDRIIVELSKNGISKYPKYDYGKLEELLRNPYSSSPGEFGFGDKSNRKDERYYLLTSEEKLSECTKSIESDSSEQSEEEKTFREFKLKTKELYELSVDDKNVFDEESYLRVFLSLQNYNRNIQDKLEKIDIDVLKLTKGTFGEKISHVLFKPIHFNGTRPEFEEYIKRTFLWQGNNIDSTSSFRTKTYKKDVVKSS